MNKFILLVFLCSFISYSQQESYYSLYKYNMQVINPAFAGAESDLSFSFLNRSQWESLDDSPKTMAFSFSSKREKKMLDSVFQLFQIKFLLKSKLLLT